MLLDFDRVCGNVGLQLNLTKTMFMRNGQVSDTPFSLNEKNISECSSYVCPSREVNMVKDLLREQGKKKRAAFKRVVKKTEKTEKATPETTNVNLRKAVG